MLNALNGVIPVDCVPPKREPRLAPNRDPPAEPPLLLLLVLLLVPPPKLNVASEGLILKLLKLGVAESFEIVLDVEPLAPEAASVPKLKPPKAPMLPIPLFLSMVLLLLKEDVELAMDGTCAVCPSLLAGCVTVVSFCPILPHRLSLLLLVLLLPDMLVLLLKAPGVAENRGLAGCPNKLLPVLPVNPCWDGC